MSFLGVTLLHQCKLLLGACQFGIKSYWFPPLFVEIFVHRPPQRWRYCLRRAESLTMHNINLLYTYFPISWRTVTAELLRKRRGACIEIDLYLSIYFMTQKQQNDNEQEQSLRVNSMDTKGGEPPPLTNPQNTKKKSFSFHCISFYFHFFVCCVLVFLLLCCIIWRNKEW